MIWLEGQAWCGGESCLTESSGRGFEQPLRGFCGGKACLGFSLPQTPLMWEPLELGLPFLLYCVFACMDKCIVCLLVLIRSVLFGLWEQPIYNDEPIDLLMNYDDKICRNILACGIMALDSRNILPCDDSS